MGLLNLRKGTEPPPAMVPERDPFRLLREMFAWEPFRDIVPAWRVETPVYLPAFEVKETKESYLFIADLPGVKETDLDISFTANRLTVAGKRMHEKEEKDETLFIFERMYGEFSRVFTLPEGIDVDHVRAELKEGVLRIVIPKLPEVQPRKIALDTDKPKV